MSTRTAKQLIYGTFYGLLWVLFFYGCYVIFLKPSVAAPTGPVCTADGCPPPGVRPIAPQGDVYSFATGDNHYTLLARIANVNSDYGASGFTYNFKLYDASGTLFDTISGQSFIYGSEQKYLIAPNEALDRPVARAELTLTNTQWVPAEKLGLVPSFGFQNLSAGAGSSTVFVSGRILNNDIAFFPKVTIIAIFKSADGVPLGASQTEIDNFTVNQAVDFSVLYPAIQGIDPAANQIAAYAERPI